MLEAKEVCKSYPTPAGHLTILENIDLTLREGESVSIIGPSGSGKSTLLYILGALETPSSGSIRLDGKDPHALDERGLAAFRNSTIGFVFQDHHLLPQCSVIENVLIPTLAADRESLEYEERARALLEQVGLSPRLDHRPGELSGGEKQRVAVARALIRSPKLLLCDEPTGNLDEDSTEAVAALLLDLHRNEKNMLVVVTHNLELASRFGRRYRLAQHQLQAA